jgi:hypothetical protein
MFSLQSWTNYTQSTWRNDKMTASIVRYNPAPITSVYRIAVFNSEGHGVAEFETVHTIGKSSERSRMIAWN